MLKNVIQYCCFLLFFWGFLCPSILSAQNNFSINKKYPPQALIEDAGIAKQAVLAMHPAIGVYQSRPYYEKLFDDLIAGLKDSLTEKEFRIKLKLVFNQLHCGHSEVLFSKAYTKAIRPMPLNFLPYYFLAVNNKLHIAIPISGKKDTLLRPGTEILKMNSIPTDSILNYTRNFITSDGYITSGKDLYMRGGFNYYYPSLFGRPDSILIEYKQKEAVKEKWIKLVKQKDLTALVTWPREDSTFTSYKRVNMSKGYINDKKAMVLKIRSFKSMYYSRRYKKIFKELEKNKTGNLVLDLRNNGGGNLSNSYKLLSYLLDSVETITLKTHVKKFPLKKYTSGNGSFRFTKWVLGIVGTKKVIGDSIWYTQKIKPQKKHRYKGNVYVLINGGSFSASCIVAAYLKQEGRAKFIGSETSGSLEGCNAGVTTLYKLPNTKLKVRVPAFRIIHDIDPTLTGRGIKPDVEVNYKIEDLLRRKDLEMMKVKEIIK